MSDEAKFEHLRRHLAEYWDLFKAVDLASWDMQTMMNPGGAASRARQLATLEKVSHERLTSDEVARLLEDLRDYEHSVDYDSDEASLIRWARRESERQRRVPSDLREEIARAGGEAYPAWVEARKRSDFAMFRPYLERNVELCRRYADCFEVAEPYDALLDYYEPGMTTAEVREVFDPLKEGLVPLIEEASAHEVDDSFLHGHFPVSAQKELEQLALSRFGFRDGCWRLDPTAHPFASSQGPDDIRMTTRYLEHEFGGIFASMHEGGHGLYEHWVAPELAGTPLARGTSLAMHESQSRMFENLVGRSRTFWTWLYPHAQRLFPGQLGNVELDAFYRAINKVQPSLIRIEADEATYGLHIILRFELEQDMVEGRVAVRDLAQVWNARMDQYLGVQVPDDARGVLQDVHWSRGYLGYFSTYELGNVISLQLWDRIRDDIADLDEQLSQGDLTALHEWLRDHVWQHGRKFMAKELLQRVVGGGIDPDPFLRYLRTKLAAPAPA